MTTTRKTVKAVTVKDEGIVSGVFATFDVIDLDGDVIRKEAVADGAPVVISAYGHRSHFGELPIGKGTIGATDTEATFEAEFFLDTPHGADAFKTIQRLEDLQEWSFSLNNVESHKEKVGGQTANVITHVDIKEVSPVLQGAGIDTRTIVAKGTTKTSADAITRSLREAARERWGDDDTYVWVEDWDPDDSKAVFAVWSESTAERLVSVTFDRDENGAVTLGEEETDVVRVVSFAPKDGARFIDHAKSVVADIERLTERTAEVVRLRRAKGRGLSAESVSLIGELGTAVESLKAAVEPPPSSGLTPVGAMIEATSRMLEDDND